MSDTNAHPAPPDDYITDIDGCCNQKGGAGKTTSAVAIAAENARRGRRVRLSDMDPQLGSASQWLLPQWDDVPRDERYTMAEVLSGECTIDQATWPTNVPGLDIVPSTRTLDAWERSSPVGGDHALKSALAATRRRYHLEMIDCPPSLNLLTITSLTAIKRLFIPLRASGLDYNGVVELNKTLKLVKARLNHDLIIAAIILSGKLPSGLVKQIVDQVKIDYPEAITQEVRNTVKCGEAPFENQALHVYAPNCTAVKDYETLTGALYQDAKAAA